MIEAKLAFRILESIRRGAPLIHNITNYVVMNFTANALPAVGASPVMAHAKEEVREMTSLSQALVINIGTLSASWIDSMIEALHEASLKQIAVVLDPVGAGATSYRNETVLKLLAAGPISVIRGNASEILSLGHLERKTKGVDSTQSSESGVEAAKLLAAKYKCIVGVSGKVDFITDGKKTVSIHNGHSLMSKVTGLGCTATALTGAFAATHQDPFEATSCAMAVIGIAGEIAAAKANGPGSFQSLFLDALYNLSEADIQSRLKASDS
jgi:hydroxyethylthiazole kinase